LQIGGLPVQRLRLQLVERIGGQGSLLFLLVLGGRRNRQRHRQGQDSISECAHGFPPDWHIAYTSGAPLGARNCVTASGRDTITLHNMRRFWPVFFLCGMMAGAQDTPNIDAGLRDLTDVSVGGWNRKLGPDHASSDRKKPALLYQPAPKPCPFARNNGGMTYEIGGPPVKEAGDFSSTQAQVLYATESGGSGLD